MERGRRGQPTMERGRRGPISQNDAINFSNAKEGLLDWPLILIT